LLLLLIMILLPGSNLESKSKSMSKSKRQRISPNSMPVGGGTPLEPAGEDACATFSNAGFTRRPFT
jgi:hypothetical protein